MSNCIATVGKKLKRGQVAILGFGYQATRRGDPIRGRNVAAAAGVVASAVLEARRKYYQSGDVGRGVAACIYPTFRVVKRFVGWLCCLPRELTVWARTITKPRAVPDE